MNKDIKILSNPNEYVCVKLTDKGRAILKDRHIELIKLYPGLKCDYIPPKEINGWTEFQLWVLIERFGPYFNCGVEFPFIELKLGSLED